MTGSRPTAVPSARALPSHAHQFTVVRQPRLRDSLVQQLVSSIVGNRLQTGASLPVEQELMQQFGVSRTVVREAIKVLETKGLVCVRQGRGMTVLPREAWDMLDSDILAAELAGHGAEQLVNELTRVRIALECEMVEQAARRVTDEQLARMEAHLACMRELRDNPDRYLDADLEFHDMILAAAGNRIAEVIMRSMHEPLRRSRRLTNQIPGGIAGAHEFHEAIFEQLCQRNAAGARAAMSEHLAWSWQAYRSMVAGGPVASSIGKAALADHLT